MQQMKNTRQRQENSTSTTYTVSPESAGIIDAATGVMNWDGAFSGTATITATSTGLCGTTTAELTVTVNPSTGVTTFTAGATIICQDAADEKYAATAENSTSTTYAVSPESAGIINAATGVINWYGAFSGTATITATSTGLCGTTTADRVVTVNPSTGATTFTAGATTLCQDAADERYTATAENCTSTTYAVAPESAGIIDAATGVMNWDATFSGTATITATSTGLCGTTTADRVVTVNPSTGVTTFTAGATTICQDAADEKYTATAENSTSTTYAVSPESAGIINAATGVMNWDGAFSGTAAITATSTGLCGTTTADRVVTVNPSTGVTTFTTGATTLCQDAADEKYTATAENSTLTSYAVSPESAGVIDAATGIMNWDGAFSGTATITATSTGLCGITTADLTVTVNPSTEVSTFTAGATTVCQDAADEKYRATAENSTSTTYAVSPESAGIIDAATGVMNWDATFSGTATITATSTGLCGTTTADRVVTVNPSTGATTFTAGATTVCQDAADEKYRATAENSTSTTYAVSPESAGIIDAATGVMNWDAAFSGTATITATSTGLCGTTTADLTVTVNPSTGATTFTTGATTICQDATDEIYTATAENSTSTSYAVSPESAGIIDAATGVMNWDATFSGTATITATSTGLCGTTTADLTVTVNPSTGATTFTAGATTICQDAADERYTATAENSTSTTYAVAPESAGIIDAATGVMNWDATFSGTATITATSTGLCGTTTADLTVTVNPSTGATTFTAGATIICQDAADEKYTATAENSTSTSYAVSPESAGIIDAATGVINWDGAFSGTATITATSTGLCGTTTADRAVTVNPSTGATTFTAGATTICQDAADEKYTATAENSTSTTYAVAPESAGIIDAATGIMNWNATFSGTATITATSTGLCGTTTADRAVTVNPSTGATTFTAGATTICQDAADERYTATAENSTSTTYAVAPESAGIIDVATGVMNWDATFSGTATITATATGLCGTTTADRAVTVNPSTGVTTFTAGATTICQDAADEKYTATAENSTSTSYAVSPESAGIIDAATGIMNWDAAFSGTATITATATGLCGTTTADRAVTVNPSTGVTTFTAGATTICQDAADEKYTATAENSTSTTYAVAPESAGIIDAATGIMNWNATFSGTATITATSTGLCGTTTADRAVTVNPSTGATTFTAGATTICQDAADEKYMATAENSTSTTYAVSPESAGIIDAATGVINWDGAFSGTATITATSTGLCGTTTADRAVTVNPSTGATTFTAGATTICQDAADEKYTATAENSTSTTYAVAPESAGIIDAATGIMNWNATFSGTATITATSTGLCGTTTADRAVTVNPSTGVTTFTAGATTLCQDAADERYTATAENSTSTTYAVAPESAGIIDAATGIMNWNATFSGTATITATSTGLCGITTADLTVTVNPATGVTTFTAGATTVCQDAADEKYTATAENSTSTTYAVSPESAGIIDVATGVMNWDAAFSGTATITATATGLCGTTTADRAVTVNPSTGATTFTAGATTICQDAADEKYTATAENSTSTTYAVAPESAGIIDAATGIMNWNATFSGTATITATSTGLCGITTADLTVTVNPATGVTTFTAGATTVCQDAADEKYTATAENSTSTTYAVSPESAGIIDVATGVMNWDGAFSGTATITATSTGLCGTTTADRAVTVNPVSLPLSVSIVASKETIFEGDYVIFDATPVNGGTELTYQWRVNGADVPQVGSNPARYGSDTLADNDVITCMVTSALPCAAGSPATSNAIKMTVNPHTFNLTLANDTQISDRSLEFDIYLLDTPPDFDFELDMLQIGIKVNPEIYNGGTITASIVENSSELNSLQNPNTIYFMQDENYIAVLSRMFPYAGNGTIISRTAPGTRVCRLRITNTQPFTAYSRADLAFIFNLVRYQTSITQYIAGLPAVLNCNTTNCFSNAANIPLNVPLIAYPVTGGGSFCEGTTGMPVGLDNSQVGVVYTLYKDGTALAPTVTGTGAAITFGNQTAAGTYTVKGSNYRGSIDMTGSAVHTVHPLPTTSLHGITGPDSYNPGSAALAAYSVDDIVNATSYIWSYNGTGVTINGTDTQVMLDFSATATNGQLSVKGHNSCGDGGESLLTIQATKTLNLTALSLEGLHITGGLMRQARDANAPVYPAGIADHITVELHSAADYETIVYTATDVPLSIEGTATVKVPGYLNDSYYITIRHRNCLLIVSATAVPFANSTITQSFGSPANVYGEKLKRLSDGTYAMYAGDVNQDNIIDLSDVSIIFNLYKKLNVTGYIPEDIDGDGQITNQDNNFIELGSSQAIKAAIP